MTTSLKTLTLLALLASSGCAAAPQARDTEADKARLQAAGLSIKNGMVTGVEVSGDTGWISGSYTVVDASGCTSVTSGIQIGLRRLPRLHQPSSAPDLTRWA